MKPYTQTIKTIILALIFSFGISFVYAWVGPTQAPPNGNASAPINTSVSTQYKGGALGVGGLIRGYANAIFDGNVGIGTVNPASKLHVAGPSGGTTGTFTDSVNSTLRIQHPSPGIARLDTDAGNTLVISSAATEKMRIDGSGNVGIGTTGPIEKLSVLGNIFLNNTADAGVRIQNGGGSSFWINSPTASLMAIGGVGGTTPTSGAINISNSGNVGIGTTAPGAKLDVVGGITKTTGGLIIETRATDPTTDLVDGRMWLIVP